MILKAATISSDRSTMAFLQTVLPDGAELELIRVIDHYPEEREVERFIQIYGPGLIFIDADPMAEALRVASALEKLNQGIQVIALHSTCEPQALLQLMRVGVREVLPLPFSSQQLQEALDRVSVVLERNPPVVRTTDRIFCFLPAKPGGGASTLAVNAALSLARLSTESERVLLADFDLHQGVVAFLLRATSTHSIMDAAERSGHLDEDLWSSVVSRRANLDVLGVGRLDYRTALTADQVRGIVDYARHVYGTICADLSGDMDPPSVEMLKNAKHIFLVCTHEVSGLHLARAKAEMLRRLELADRASILLNRSEKRSTFSIEEIEKMVGLRVRFSFPNDEKRVASAVTSGQPVDTNSDLGRQIDSLAKSMMATETLSATPGKRSRLAGYFTIPPVTLSIGSRRE